MRAASDPHETAIDYPRWLVAAGLLGLLVPTYLDVYRVFWTTRDGSYGAVMFLLIAWLVWRERRALGFADPSLPAPASKVLASHRAAAWVVFTTGLLGYVLGRSQSFYQLEVAAEIPILLGLLWLVHGGAALRRLWFPIVLLVFVIPVPGSVADEMLLPLKELVSRAVDNVLHLAGYPIARNGVVLMIGPYSLLIADACSGLNSIIALSGVGLVYVHLAKHSRAWMKLTLIASIVPIALIANVLRVLGLVLVTYYAGDSFGIGFHDLAGYLEVLFAFGAFFVLDHLLGRHVQVHSAFPRKVLGK